MIYSIGDYVNILSNGMLRVQDGTSLVATGDSALTKLRKAVKYQLLQITAANGYRSDIRAVYDPPRSEEQMNEHPCVNLQWGDERRTNDHLAGNRQMLDLEIQCQMDFFAQSQESPVDVQDDFIADAQERFGNNNEYYIIGQDGQRTAFNCVYAAHSRGVTDLDVPLIWVSVVFDIWYRIRIDDATQIV